MFPPTKHAKISPSKLKRIIECPASFQFATTLEQDNEQSVYAAEGSHLHYAIETYIELHVQGYVVDLTAHPVTADIVSPALNDEQIEAVENALEYLGNLLNTLRGPSLTGYVEAEVTLAKYHHSLVDCYGTCDIILRTDSELHVLDWKFGAGIPVYVNNNDQLYAYAAGAAQSFEDLLVYDSVTLHIVQPRTDNYDSITLQPEELIRWVEGRLIPGVQAAYHQHARFNPGPEQCRWCPAKVKCVARYNAANQTAADVFRAHANMPDEVTLEELTEIVSRADLFESYIKEVRQYLRTLLEQGKEVPGFKLVQGRSVRQWGDVSVAEEWLLDNFDYEDIYDVKLVSAPKAMKLTKDKNLKKAMEELIIKPEGKTIMVSADDRRPAVEFKTAEQVFAGMEEE